MNTVTQDQGEITMITFTRQQARQFILLKQGLLGDYKFHGKQGVMEFVRQAGCIQFDPIDVCGKNAELVLQSRVKGFTKQMLYELLYEDRQLIDYFDKNLAIMDIHDWPYFERIREENRTSGRGKDEVNEVADEIIHIIEKSGPISSSDVGFDEKVDWYWSNTKLSRAALETLYFRGDLIVHHKSGTKKYYALSKDYIPSDILNEKDPLKDEIDHLKWRVLRRISAVGLLWNKPSDAWLYIWGLKAQERNQVFKELLVEQKILEVKVEGCKDMLYCLSSDLPIIKQVYHPATTRKRMEFIAALDSFLWDRKLIKELFDFEYKWEIYTPAEQRKYGYYVLPILYGEDFCGRIEAVCDRKSSRLTVKNIWFEDGVRVTKKLKQDLLRCLERFRKFNDMETMDISNIPELLI